MNKDNLHELIAKARRNEILGWMLVILSGIVLVRNALEFPEIYRGFPVISFLLIMWLGISLPMVLLGIGVVLVVYFNGTRKKYMKKLSEVRFDAYVP